MCLPKNEHTDYTRSLINDWLIKRDETPFSVRDICNHLRTVFDFGDVDLTKAVSNELLRHKKSKRLIDVGEDEAHIGRPAKLYKQVWCNETLAVLRLDILESKIEAKAGVVRIYVYGMGMVRILKPFNVSVTKKNVREMVDYHLMKNRKIMLDGVS